MRSGTKKVAWQQETCGTHSGDEHQKGDWNMAWLIGDEGFGWHHDVECLPYDQVQRLVRTSTRRGWISRRHRWKTVEHSRPKSCTTCVVRPPGSPYSLHLCYAPSSPRLLLDVRRLSEIRKLEVSAPVGMWCSAQRNVIRNGQPLRIVDSGNHSILHSLISVRPHLLIVQTSYNMGLVSSAQDMSLDNDSWMRLLWHRPWIWICEMWENLGAIQNSS